MPGLNQLPATANSRSTPRTIATRRGRHCALPWAGMLRLGVGLSVAGGLLITPAPAPVYAYTGNVSVTIDAQPGESYETLMRRAEAIARAATQRSFDRDILITDVSITIIAQTPTATAPILSLTATRPQWRSQPDPRRWATYYSSSKRLLGLSSTPAAAPVTQPTVTTTSPARPMQSSPTTTPSKSPTGGTTATGSTQPSTSQPFRPIPKRIPTPGNIGK